MISLDVTSLVKTIVAIVLAGVVLLLWGQQRRLIPWLAPRERTVRWLAFVGLRLVPFVIIYLILDQEPRSDVKFFWDRAVPAYAGKMVYRDFISYHAPIFTYLTVLPLLIWYNARSIILFMALMEFIILNATYRYALRRNVPTGEALLRYVLYYTLPVSFVAIVLSSEEDIWFWGFGLLSLALLARGADATSRSFAYRAGLIWGLGMVVIKFMLIVLIIPLFFLIRQRWWFVLGLLSVGIPTIAVLYSLMDIEYVLMPIQHSSYPMAPNLASVLRPIIATFLGDTKLTSLNWIGLLGVIGGGSWVAWQARHIGYERAFVPFFCFLFTIFMILLPSAPGYYIYVHLATLSFFILDNTRTHWVRMAILNVLLTVQPILMVVYADNRTYTSIPMLFQSPIFLLDYVIQVISVVMLVWLARLCYQKLQAAGQPSNVPQSVS